MDAQIKEEWVKRLRSGDYQQAQQVLIESARDSTGAVEPVGYCCLGVLVDYAIESGCPDVRYMEGTNKTEVEVRRPDDFGFDDGSDGWIEFTDNDLPGEVGKWAGLALSNPANPAIGGTTLIALNDDSGATFDDIANAIDSNL